MTKKTENKADYLILFTREYAKRHNISEKQAFNYLDRHKGMSFLSRQYNAMHVFDFDYAISSIDEVCQANSGLL